jgi:DNA-binding response OmpR family regulator
MLGSRPSDNLLQSALRFRYGFGVVQRILVLEGDRDVAREIGYQLERAGYDVLPCSTGAEALDLIDQIGLPNLAVVDARLPDIDGLAFCRRMRRFSDLPIVLLAPAGGGDDLADVLQECADDYVAKPLSPRDLVTRVQRAMRQVGSGLVVAPLVQVDEHLAVDFVHQQALVCGRAVAITPLESKILHILMRHAGRVVTSDYLLTRLGATQGACWGLDNTLQVHIERLRQKIEPNPGQASYILDAPQTGYSFGR